MVIGGYAFAWYNDNVKVVNLHHLESVAVLTSNGVILETNMNDGEAELVSKLLKDNFEFMDSI